MLFFVVYILTALCVLLSVAFFTLFERKALGLIQNRLGPTKVGILGIFQPFSDAVKLFSKFGKVPQSSSWFFFLLGPSLSLVCPLILWAIQPLCNSGGYFYYSLLLFFCITSVNVYSVLFMGWSSNSKYSLLGSIRCIAQMISYEITLALILISVFYLKSSLMISDVSWKIFSPFLLLLSVLFVFWLVICLAETNRAPFDFAEGESELVSGHNIEYGAGGFAVIFLGEYSSIIFLSVLTGYIWLGFESSFCLVFLGLVFCYFFVWSRGSLPRDRYDFLMGLTWKSFLPVSIGVCMLVFSLN